MNLVGESKAIATLYRKGTMQGVKVIGKFCPALNLEDALYFSQKPSPVWMDHESTFSLLGHTGDYRFYATGYPVLTCPFFRQCYREWIGTDIYNPDTLLRFNSGDGYEAEWGTFKSGVEWTSFCGLQVTTFPRGFDAFICGYTHRFGNEISADGDGHFERSGKDGSLE